MKTSSNEFRKTPKLKVRTSSFGIKFGELYGSSLEPLFESLTKTYLKLLELGLVYHEKEAKCTLKNTNMRYIL